jgi:hypothetical protein
MLARSRLAESTLSQHHSFMLLTIHGSEDGEGHHDAAQIRRSNHQHMFARHVHFVRLSRFPDPRRVSRIHLHNLQA